MTINPLSPIYSNPTPVTPARRRAKHFFGKVREYTRLRMKFIELVVLRGLGIRQPRTLDPALLQRGLTLVLPGIESESVFTYAMCDGLHEGGVTGAIRVFNWGLPFPGGYLANLTWVDRNRKRAKDIAAEIVRYQRDYPGRPVHLVAQSGGAGVAVFAVEALPEGTTVDGIVLLGGALSPTYNLAKALAKTRKGILNSHSSKDSVILNWGTRLFGTTDRRFTPAAGCVGFVIPKDATEPERPCTRKNCISCPGAKKWPIPASIGAAIFPPEANASWRAISRPGYKHLGTSIG